MDTQLPVMVVDYRRTKRKITSLIPQLSDSFGPSFVLSDSISILRSLKTLGKSSWSMNIYCTRAASCEEKHGYLENAEGS